MYTSRSATLWSMRRGISSWEEGVMGLQGLLTGSERGDGMRGVKQVMIRELQLRTTVTALRIYAPHLLPLVLSAREVPGRDPENYLPGDTLDDWWGFEVPESEAKEIHRLFARLDSEGVQLAPSSAWALAELWEKIASPT